MIVKKGLFTFVIGIISTNTRHLSCYGYELLLHPKRRFYPVILLPSYGDRGDAMRGEHQVYPDEYGFEIANTRQYPEVLTGKLLCKIVAYTHKRYVCH